MITPIPAAGVGEIAYVQGGTRYTAPAREEADRTEAALTLKGTTLAWWIIGYGIVAFRDPHGIRPLVLGIRETPNGVEHMVASESVALDAVGFELERDILPGDAVFIHFTVGGSPADFSIAGQYTQWWRTMSLPMRWKRSSAPAQYFS